MLTNAKRCVFHAEENLGKFREIPKLGSVPLELLRTLENSALDQYFSREDLTHLARFGHFEEVESGETLIEDGARACCLFILLDGELEVLGKAPQKAAKRVETLGPEALIGGGECLSETAMNGTIRAVRKSRVFRLEATVFEELLRAQDTAALKLGCSIGSYVATRLRDKDSESAQTVSNHQFALDALEAILTDPAVQQEIFSPDRRRPKDLESFRQRLLRDWDY
jgi:CRP-like cAMP-binding protein